MKKKILLTGATGFVGGNFLIRHKEDFDIKPISLRSQSPEEILYAGIDCIIHCAALVHQMKGAPEEEYFRINFWLTKKLADNAKKAGVKHFIFLSTAHVFGDSGNLYDHKRSLNESSACCPKDAYGRSKLAAENYLLSIQDSTFTVSIIRPPMVYGRGAKGNILNLVKLIQTCPILPLKYDTNKRSIIFVGNLCLYIALIAKKNISGIFLPQDEKSLSTKELVENLATTTNRKIHLFSPPSFLLHIIFKLLPKISRRLFGTLELDGAKNNVLIGYHPAFTTKEGLKETIGIP